VVPDLKKRDRDYTVRRLRLVCVAHASLARALRHLSAMELYMILTNVSRS